MKRLFLSGCIILASAFALHAQYDAQFSQYFKAMNYYNPAVAGNTDDLNALAFYRLQWQGIPNAPRSFFITADMPLSLGKTRHGAGIIVYTDEAGLFRNTHYAAQYACKFKLFNGTLSVGMQLGVVNQSFDGTGVYIPPSDGHVQADDAFPTTKVQAMAFDMNLGLYFSNRHLYAGIATTHLTQPQLQLEENIYTYIGRAYNFTAGYNIQLNNPLYEIQPSVFIKTDMQSIQADITGRVVYNKMFNGGISWRINESAVLMFGATIGRFDVGYAYDFPITSLLKGSSGSHEIMVRYRIKLQKSKTGKFKHKSVRIL